MKAHQVRRFHLKRDVDVSGVSGTGVVAFGVQAPNGTCVLWWDSEHESIGIYPSMDTLLAVHGHSGSTWAVFVDDPVFVDDSAADSVDDPVALRTVPPTRAAAANRASASASRASARTATARANGGRAAPSRGAGRSMKASRPAAGRTATASLTTSALATQALATPAVTTQARTTPAQTPGAAST